MGRKGGIPRSAPARVECAFLLKVSLSAPAPSALRVRVRLPRRRDSCLAPPPRVAAAPLPRTEGLGHLGGGRGRGGRGRPRSGRRRALSLAAPHGPRPQGPERPSPEPPSRPRAGGGKVSENAKGLRVYFPLCRGRGRSGRRAGGRGRGSRGAEGSAAEGTPRRGRGPGGPTPGGARAPGEPARCAANPGAPSERVGASAGGAFPCPWAPGGTPALPGAWWPRCSRGPRRPQELHAFPRIPSPWPDDLALGVRGPAEHPLPRRPSRAGLSSQVLG